MSTLRIGIDGRAFTSRAGGVRRYVRELAGALPAVDPGVQLVAIGPEENATLPQHVAAQPASSRVPTNLGWSVDGLPRAWCQAGLDLFHAPAYTAPLWGVHPTVLTIHDVSYARHSEWYPHARDPFRRWFYRRSAMAADVIITDSEFSRREIEAAYGIGGDRVRVVPLGVGAPFTGPTSLTEDDILRPPYILHIGDLHPRRNIGLLVDVLALIRSRTDAMRLAELVLVGVDRGSGTGITALAKAAGLASAVRMMGPQDDATVVRLLRGAALFAYPSLYEGFGLPLLEAMACGVPVVASTAASIPEVVGDAGILVDPHDVRGWHDAIVAVLGSAHRRAVLRDAGRVRAAKFTWCETARLTLEVYASMIRGRRAKAPLPFLRA
jgi:glycosyltransferase involved in cell wall biosynthesis